MKRYAKKCLAAIFILALTLSLFGCSTSPADNPSGGSTSGSSSGGSSSGGSSGGSSQTPARTDLTYGLTGDPQSLDPAKSTDQMSRAVWTQMYETIARRKSDGTYEKRVAESWEMSPDGSEVTIKLKKGIKFHDGSELTAEDVAFTYNRLAEEPKTKGMMVSMTGSSTTVVDPYTVKVTLTAPYGPIVDVLCIEGRIIPKAYFESVGAEGFAAAPVGCGPFRFVERKTGEKIVLTQFEDYYGTKPAIKDVTFKIITDTATAVASLEKGELDFLSHAPLSAKRSIQDNKKLSWYETPIKGLIYVCFRLDSPIFQDVKVRKAIQMGIDKTAMVIGGVEGNGTPVSTMIPESCICAPQGFPDVTYDLEGAKKLLKEAGYPAGFSVTLYTQENATYSKPTQVLQGQLQAMGINAEIEVMERSAFFAGQTAANQYEIWVSHWTAPTGDSDFIYQLAHSSMIGATNTIKVNDPALDAALDKGRTSSNAADRVAAYTKACQIIQDNAYWVPVYTFAAPCAANKALNGVIPDDIYVFYVSDWSW